MAYGSSRTPGSGIPLRIATALVIVAAYVLAANADSLAPMRAFWISPSMLSSTNSIRRAVATAAAEGFDAVIAPLSVGAGSDADPTGARAEVLRQARDRGLAAHVSVTVNVATAVGELPASRDHVIYQHPEWLMVPRELASEMLRIDVRSPAYLGRIARWTRANTDRVDGIYVSPLDPGAASYLVNAVASAVGQHGADGVYLDALDFPGDDFDYSRHAMELFRSHMRGVLPAAERARLDVVEDLDPFTYAEEFPDEWRQFRQSALTDLLERLRTTLAAARPALAIAAGARADADAALRDHFQSWRAWLERGLIDRIGYRSRSTGLVLLSRDGVFAAALERLPGARTAGSGGPR